MSTYATRNACTLVFASIFLISTTASAQIWDMLTAPKVPVTITHPPLARLKLTRVVITPGAGDCATELVENIRNDLAENNIDVLDRERMEEISAELKLTSEGATDPATATRIGKLVGAAALIRVNVMACRSDHQRTTETALLSSKQVYVAVTIFRMKGSFSITDLTTGKRIPGGHQFDATVQRANRTDGGFSYPADEDVRTDAFTNAQQMIHRTLLPWTENTQLYFFNDRECEIRDAFDTLRRGDNEGALQKAKTSVDRCTAPQATGLKPKTIGHAYYNLGMAYFIQSDFDQALVNFEKANQYIPGAIVNESVANCQKAKQLAAEAARVESMTAIGDADRPGRQASTAESRNSKPTSGSDSNSPEARLKKLNDFYKKGLINKQEYEKKKAEILKDM